MHAATAKIFARTRRG